MLDYQAIAALSAVIESQSFQKASDKLFITQSAVSQRIKSLEHFYGEPVLIRTHPYRPTSLGLSLLRQYKRILLLEDSFHEELQLETKSQRISIAISRDSLETWFVTVMEQLKQLPNFMLEITADDQDVTFNYFQNGLVSACASTHSKNLSGCHAEFLGYFNYVLVASPEFKNKYFHDKKNTCNNLIQAPAILFDHKDELHKKYLKEFFKIENETPQYHIVPSVAAFRQFALSGYAYGLIPELDIIDELKQGTLVELFPDKKWKMPVYWHYWSVETHQYKLFNDLVIAIGKEIFASVF